MMPFFQSIFPSLVSNSSRLGRATAWRIAAGLPVAAFLAMLALPAHAVLPDSATTTGFSTVMPLSSIPYRDATLIRVGISDDDMTAQEYPSTRISATGPFTIKDKRSGTTFFSGRAGESATITVDRLGFHVNTTGLTPRPSPRASLFFPGLFSSGFLSSGFAANGLPDVPCNNGPEGNGWNHSGGSMFPAFHSSAFDTNLSNAALIAALPPNIELPAMPPQATPDPLLKLSIPVVPLSGGNSDGSSPLLVQTVHASDRLKITNITRRHEVPQYRGIFEIVRGSSSPNKLSVVNVLSLEDYLKAVVPNELPMRYGWEAVKAQSVAARNYAIRPREKPWKTFDICDSQLCQVYLGSQTETPDSNRAIGETEGLVGIFEGDPILALFSSSHGGVAEDYSNAFSDPLTKQYPAPPIPYLKGGPDLPLPAGLDLRTEEGARRYWTDTTARSFDVESPYYRWEKRWTRAEMETAINTGLLTVSKDSTTRDFVSPLLQPGQTIGTLQNIRVLSRGISGKAMIVSIEASRGTWTVKKEFLIRKVFQHSGKALPSANIVFTLENGPQGLATIIANGGGFGHGVGLSQLGASWMSGHGIAFSKIVQHYYKGVSLGSAPIALGGATPSVLLPQPVLTRFGVKDAHGTLWVQEGESGVPSAYNHDPIALVINGQRLQVAPSGYRSSVPVDGSLRAGQINTLVLFPDERHPGRRIKAWVELYPAIEKI